MDRLTLSFIFGAGIVAQTLLFVLNTPVKKSFQYLAWAAGIGLTGLLPGKNEQQYDLYFHVSFCFVIYAFMVFILFKKEIMARVSESSLLVSSLVFWYLCASYFNGTTAQIKLMALAALPTLATLIIAMTIRKWSFAVRFSCYVWFLLLTLAISCFQVHFGAISFLWSDEYAAPAPFDLFLTGMAFTYLSASLFYIYILIPLAGKHQTQAERMVIWRQDAHQMASCFSDYQMTAPQATSILIFQGGLYALNYRFRWLPVLVMVNLTLLLIPSLFQILSRLD